LPRGEGFRRDGRRPAHGPAETTETQFLLARRRLETSRPQIVPVIPERTRSGPRPATAGQEENAMTYPSENFYPAIEARKSSGGVMTDCVEAFEGVSRRAAAAVERTRLTAEYLAESYAYWRCMRETSRQLSGLDDATLRDIGLHRSQIMHVARRLALKKLRPVSGRGGRGAG
jgi:uncharacterized protein YjiS (DUF1127 family)